MTVQQALPCQSFASHTARRVRPLGRRCLGVLLALLPAVAPGQTALVVYTEPEEYTGGLVNARHLEALLGHFPELETRLVSTAQYASGQAAAADLVFYVGSPVTDPPPALLADLSTADRACWLGAGAGKLATELERSSPPGFRVRGEGPRDDVDRVSYRGAELGRGSSFLVEIEVPDPSRVEVVAEVGGGEGKRLPYALRTGGLWVFADNPLAYFGNQDRYLVFADLLHEIVGREHERSHRAIVRIADVNPRSDARQLRDLANLLQAEGVPFLVSLVPSFVEPSEQTHLKLAERPELVQALQYMQMRGGALVLHGATHRHTGRTLEDLEFWDARLDRPLPGDNADSVRRKLDAAIDDLLVHDLLPLAWETPGHLASELDYRTIGQIFSTAIETRLAADRRSSGFSVPFVVERDRYGQRLLPDNLGYVAADAPGVDSVLTAAAAARVVRDGVASFQFHPFVERSRLSELIAGLRDLGFSFLDLRSLDTFTVTRERAIVTGAATVRLDLGSRTLDETVLDGYHRVTSSRRTERAGSFERTVEVEPGSFYVARPVGDDDALDEAAGISLAAAATAPQRDATERSFLADLLDRLRAPGRSPVEARAHLLWVEAASEQLAAEQEGLEIALSSYGVTVERVPVESAAVPAEASLLAAPGAAAAEMPPAALASWLAAVREGALLLTTGPGPLQHALGVRLGTAVEIQDVAVLQPARPPLRWPQALAVPPVAAGGDQVLLRDEATGEAVAVSGRFGGGRFLFFSAPFSASGTGHDLHPDLPLYLRELGLQPLLGGTALEVFFDPGLRPASDLPALVASWRRRGVRVVHAAAWHFYQEYEFDYDRLLDEAHRNGILVYAWLEPPQVTADFWLERPHCREKNHRGDDARPDWRYPVALTDESCRSEALAAYARLLDAHDWDGVNVAELSFFGAGGFAAPDHLTPFHPSATRLFRQRHGFAPADLLDPESPRFHRRDAEAMRRFVDFRVEWVVRLHRELLELAHSTAARKPLGFETVVTVLDSLAAPELRTDLGIDVARLLELREELEFSVAVEDPASMWSLPPERYEEIAARYLELGVPPERLLVDINVLAVRAAGEHGYPTAQQTGVELMKLGRAATAHTPRALVYAESTLWPEDADLLPHALSSRASVARLPGGWRVRSSSPVALELGRDAREVWVDGEPWAAREAGRILLPAGEHEVTFSRAGLGRRLWGEPLARPQVLRSSVDLSTAVHTETGIAIAYESLARVALVLSVEPAGVSVDGLPFEATTLDAEPGVLVFLPAGRRSVELRYEQTLATTARRALHHTAHGTLTLIAVFGLTSCSVLGAAFLSTLSRTAAQRRSS